MSRAENFNNEAMEEKIKKNIAQGFTLQQIRECLMDELKGCLKTIHIYEARACELIDQVDYINEKYGEQK